MRCTVPHLILLIAIVTFSGLPHSVAAHASVDQLNPQRRIAVLNSFVQEDSGVPRLLNRLNESHPSFHLKHVSSKLIPFSGVIDLAHSESEQLANSLVIGWGLWPTYPWRILGAVALIVFQGVLIMGLLLERRRRSKATDSLAESEERYRNVVETQTELICRFKPDTTLTFVNDAYCRFFGKTRRELIGQKFIELLPANSRQATRDHIRSLIGHHNTSVNEHEVIKPDGSIGWHQWINRVISEVPEIELQGIGRDVTEQKLAERALQESEERNRAILNAIPDLMFLQDSDGVFLDYHTNDSSALLVHPEQFIGKNMKEVLSPPLASALRRKLDRARQTHELQLLEYDVELNGERRWYEARVAPCNGSKTLSVVRDITERKKAEMALTYSEEFNRRIVESSVESIKILDLEGNLLYISPNGQRLLGIHDNVEAYLNSSWANLWPQADKIRALEAIDRARLGDVGSFHAHGLTPDGIDKWWDTLVTPIVGASGHIERLLAVSRDVTEQKLATAAIEASEERFAKAFRSNPQPMSLTTLDEGLYLDVNDSFLTMSGYARDEVIGRTSTELRIFETIGHRSLLVEPLRANNQVRNLELKFRTKTGRLRVLLSSAELLEINGQTCVLVASSDITDRKVLEEDLRLSERDFSTLVENSPDVIARLDRQLRYTYISPNSKELTGLEPQHLLGRTPRQFPADSLDPLSLESASQEALNTGKTVHRSFQRNGKSYSTRIIPEHSKDGSVESVMMITEDVTERTQASEELQQLTMQLLNLQDQERRRIARELHDVTAQNLFAVSVDLRNISQLLPQDETRVQSLIGECQSLANQSLQEIRTLSYLLHPPLLDQAGLVSALQWYVEGFNQRSGISVDVKAQPIGRLASEVEMALFRVVQEALTNVRRHSGSETATIKLERKSGEVLLEIRDRGRGMTVKGHLLSDEDSMELGVGIPGMRQRLRQLGGRLEIASDDHGTAISAVVPIAKEASYGAYSSGG